MNVIDVACHKPSPGLSNLVETPHTSTTPRALRQLNREKNYLCFGQNTNTTSCTENKCKSKRLATTAHTHSVEGSHNSNKISQSKSTFDITHSEGAVGLDVLEDTLTTPSEGAPRDAHFIDRNANKDSGRVLT